MPIFIKLFTLFLIKLPYYKMNQDWDVINVHNASNQETKLLCVLRDPSRPRFYVFLLCSLTWESDPFGLFRSLMNYSL